MSSPVSRTDIAIIGMAGRFPGARDISEFWSNLSTGVESIVVLADLHKWANDHGNGSHNGRNIVRARAMLSDPEYFDAGFFDISPREAELMDPQHRALLECAWEGLECA